MILTLLVFSLQFGGKLVAFGLPNTTGPRGRQPCPRLVFISQVTTETEFLQRAAELRQALGAGTLSSFCQNKIQQVPGHSEKLLWQFLKVGNLMAVSPWGLLRVWAPASATLRGAQAHWSLLGLGFCLLCDTHCVATDLYLFPEAQRLFAVREAET